MYVDGSNAENKISLLVILCIIMYVKKKISKPIMVKCLNIGKNIGRSLIIIALLITNNNAFKIMSYKKWL